MKLHVESVHISTVLIDFGLTFFEKSIYNEVFYSCTTLRIQGWVSFGFGFPKGGGGNLNFVS